MRHQPLEDLPLGLLSLRRRFDDEVAIPKHRKIGARGDPFQGRVLVTPTLSLNALAIILRYRLRKRLQW